MEKIIGGIDFDDTLFPMEIKGKLLWPCYEFIARAEGIDDYEKNILEEFILRLADINVTDIKETAECLGVEDDLVSFIQSRLQQQECLDECFRITSAGKTKLGEFAENRCINIHVYVDAVSGRIVPYYSPLDSENSFKYYSGYFDKGRNLFKYKGYTTAGKEIDEELEAYLLCYNNKYDQVPDGADVTAMLRKLHPGKDGVFAKIDLGQPAKKNLCWILLDVMQPESSSRDWVFTDGFGELSSFFSVMYIDEADQLYISGLRDLKMIQTNAEDFFPEPVSPEIDKKFPRLGKKISFVQENMKESEIFVDSPDREEELLSATSRSALYLAQLAEWVLFYILHNGEAEYKAEKVLCDLKKSRPETIVELAKKYAGSLGFDYGKDEKCFLKKDFRKLRNAFKKVPSMAPLLDIFLIGLADEPWLRAFAKEHPGFLTSLAELNKKRNASFHSGDVNEISVFKDCIEKARKEIFDLMKAGLGIEVTGSSSVSFKRKIDEMNERNAAIGRMENSLGFTLCRTLDINLIRFITDMECRGADKASLKNAVVIDQYKILEHLFVSVNESTGDEYKNSDWETKCRKCGLKTEESGMTALRNTSRENIDKALGRKKSSMNAACIAFCTLADGDLLRGIAKEWPEMLIDVSYIAGKRGHGEIPDEIDLEKVLEIKKHIVDLIKFFAENGFLTGKHVN